MRPAMFLGAGLAMVGILMVTAHASPGNIVVSGFQTPESVVHDPIADVYLVSNIGTGSPAALDHNGFISRVSPEGSILQLKWIQDGVNGAVLNGPKGLWLFDDALYVSDIDTLRIFDRFSGAPRRNIPIPNPFAPSALFLNDVTVSQDGTAYLTDNVHSGLFKVDPAGVASVVAVGAQLGSPNGVLANGANISWVTWIGHQVLRTNPSGKIFTDATLPTVDVSQLGLPPGTLLMDGYARLPDDSLLVSSWVTGAVYRISPSGKDISVVAQFVSFFANPNNPDGPADINVDLLRDRLLVPLFDANQLVIVPLS
jgi:sugar lactone lactonase YvrE